MDESISAEALSIVADADAVYLSELSDISVIKIEEPLSSTVPSVAEEKQSLSPQASSAAKKEQPLSSQARAVASFGEKEFQAYSQQKADKNVCDGKGATVKVSFFIDKSGKPSKIKFKSYSCEDAKKEIENLLSISPVWTETGRKVTMTIQWGGP